MYGSQQPVSLGQLPSGIPAEVGPVAAGSTQLPAAYYNQTQQYAANSRSAASALGVSLTALP